MSSTYSSRLRLELIANGEKVGTWGTATNTNLGTLIEEAISGWKAVTMADADYTLVASNGVSDEARNMVVSMVGTLTANRNVICPTSAKTYVIHNATTGGFSITIKTSGGTGATITSGSRVLVYCDGTNVNAVTVTTGSAAQQSIGTSGATVPLLSTANTWTLAQTFTTAPVFSDASGTRTALALSSMATMSAASVAITGGSITGLTTFSAASDRRLKTDITALEPGLSYKLHPVRYRWRKSQTHSIGLIAQDLQKVMPELVHEDEHGMLSIQYHLLCAVLLSDIQDLAKRVWELERK